MTKQIMRSLYYQYYSNNNLKIHILEINGYLLEYDEYARQTKLIDVNAGTTNYVYNNYNQLVTQTNANGQTSNIYYDVLGRMTSKVLPGRETTSYEYFPAWLWSIN
ncbi:MAG: RHS repeat domain-containing protein [Saprospiraceae bacterium]